MKCIIQRVKEASVVIDGKKVADMGKGLLVYVGFRREDKEIDVDFLLDRIKKIRIFEDAEGKLNLALSDVGAGILLVPNFTLYADAFTGRRPSFTQAMGFEDGKKLFDYTVRQAAEICVGCGVFGADMQVNSVGDGPINIIIESCEGKAKL